MKLMTAELEKRFAEIGSQEESKDPIVVAHFFNPKGAGDWYATDYDPTTRIIFGFARIFYNPFDDEWGYTSLDELEAIRNPNGLGIERDLYWTEKRFSQIKL